MSPHLQNRGPALEGQGIKTWDLRLEFKGGCSKINIEIENTGESDWGGGGYKLCNFKIIINFKKIIPLFLIRASVL